MTFDMSGLLHVDFRENKSGIKGRVQSENKAICPSDKGLGLSSSKLLILKFCCIYFKGSAADHVTGWRSDHMVISAETETKAAAPRCV